MWYPHEKNTIEAIVRQINKLKLNNKFKDELDLQTLLPGGDRALIDLFALSKSGVFYPNTKGSNSIKKILPAAIKHSKFLQKKYSKPIYGCNQV